MLFRKVLKKFLWIVYYDCNSCNGCDIEIFVMLIFVYDVERFGIINVGNFKYVDILVVLGFVNYRNVRVLKIIYE